MKIKDKIQFHYDRDGDVLYVSFGKPKPAKSIEKDNGIHIRIDPFNDEIIGFTVINYMYQKRKGLLHSIPDFENIKLPWYSN